LASFDRGVEFVARLKAELSADGIRRLLGKAR